ncbi:MAG: BrnA antitoxin family protein [Treponema sp.]|nr:BrnA antitoxin family protein [Treponema sp.]
MGKVSYTLENLPPVSKKDLDRVDSIKDEDIDYSDIPEFKDFSGFHPWQDRKLYKPIKVAVTCKLDADIVAWLKQGGKGYQTRLNKILRQVMVHAQ